MYRIIQIKNKALQKFFFRHSIDKMKNDLIRTFVKKKDK